MYATESTKLKADLEKCAHVSLTTDGWTARNTESYVTVTVHWLDSSWELKSAVLETVTLSESHTAQNLTVYLNKVIDAWGIRKPTNPELKIAITSDNASNIVKAIRDGGFRGIRCFAHTVNLAAQRGLGVTSVSNVLAHVRRLVKYFSKSSLAANMLKEKQALLDIPAHSIYLSI